MTTLHPQQARQPQQHYPSPPAISSSSNRGYPIPRKKASCQNASLQLDFSPAMARESRDAQLNKSRASHSKHDTNGFKSNELNRIICRDEQFVSTKTDSTMGHKLQSLTIGAVRPIKEHKTREYSHSQFDISTSTRHLSIRDDHPNLSILCQSLQIPEASTTPSRHASTACILTPTAGELPPLQMDSPKSEAAFQSLPSIRSTLGDIDGIATDVGQQSPPGRGLSFNHPTQLGQPRLPEFTHTSLSPPVSPNERYRRGLPLQPTKALIETRKDGSKPMGIPTSELDCIAPTLDFNNFTTSHITPNSSQTSSVLRIDGITNQQGGHYVCKFSGCNAHPFQTQYLLNSHANVHSSARPHYCPVKGCSRSEGGKGFKRKNEMIRHGLVHDSPGYICPFCPDREHRYPRPDNLQR